MKQANIINTSFSYRYPVVTILGHVDHGKTTLLDTIRKTNLASQETGGITQHIGAYQITVAPKGQTITFIDTPGHEAFAKMRMRGANVADIAVLVVAANDGIMPQTIESIKHIQSAKIPCIVAVNKIDLPDVNIEKIKKQLTREGLKLEEYGGDIPLIPLSAKKGQGIDKLLDMILLLNELYRNKERTNTNLEAVVIEATLSKNRGPVATVIVRNGILKVGEEYNCNDQLFKIRALIDWKGQKMEEAKVGQPAEILGWKKVPSVGSIVYNKNSAEKVNFQSHPITIDKKIESVPTTDEKITSTLKLRLIIKTDSFGSLEAILHGLKDNVEIILSSVGAVSESDVLLAKTTKSIIIGFNIEIPESVVRLSQSEKVFIKNFDIIYEVFQEIDDVSEALKQGNLVTIFGQAKIIATFNYNEDKVAGVEVTSGRIARGDQIKVVRDDQEIGRARIKSIRHLKEDINRADQGTQAGVILTQKVDFLTGDSIISIG